MRTIAILFLVLFTIIANAVMAEQVGDMDGDDQVSIKEAIIALQVAAGLSPTGLGEYTPASGNATPEDVMENKTFSNDSGHAEGTIPIRTLNPSAAEVNQGYYESTSLTTVDKDLITRNIVRGIEVFGVVGESIPLWGCVRAGVSWTLERCIIDCSSIMTNSYQFDCDTACSGRNPEAEERLCDLCLMSVFCGSSIP